MFDQRRDHRLRPLRLLDTYDPAAVGLRSTSRAATPTASSRASRSGIWRGSRRRCCRCSIREGAAIGIAETILGSFAEIFQTAYIDGLRRKLGLPGADPGDTVGRGPAARDAEHEADYTLTSAPWPRIRYRRAPRTGPRPGAAAVATRPAGATRIRAANPAVIPRNHLVEAAITAAVEREDFAPFHALVEALANPYADAADPTFAAPPLPAQRVLQTFCGT